jgi:hypothetical protein
MLTPLLFWLLGNLPQPLPPAEDILRFPPRNVCQEQHALHIRLGDQARLRARLAYTERERVAWLEAEEWEYDTAYLWVRVAWVWKSYNMLAAGGWYRAYFDRGVTLRDWDALRYDLLQLQQLFGWANYQAGHPGRPRQPEAVPLPGGGI